jgi:hypothetical protein
MHNRHMSTLLSGWDCRDDGHLWNKEDVCVMCHAKTDDDFVDDEDFPLYPCIMCGKVYPTQLERDLCTPEYLIAKRYPHRAKDYQ